MHAAASCGVLPAVGGGSHAIEHSTLQDLYACYTREVRDRLERRFGRLDWELITGSLVGHMSNNEVLAAPVGVLDSVEQRQVRGAGF